MYSQRLPNTRSTCTSTFSTEDGEISLLSPPEQFIDTNNSNNCFLKTSELDIEKWYLDNDHKEPLCAPFIPKTTNRSHQADPQNLTSQLSVYQTSGPQEIGSVSNNQIPPTGPLKEEDNMNSSFEDVEFLFFPEEEDSGEFLFSELTMYFPELTNSVPLFRDTRKVKTREDYMRELFYHGGNMAEEEDIIERIDINKKTNIPIFDQMTEELHLAIDRIVKGLKDEEECLQLEHEEIEND